MSINHFVPEIWSATLLSVLKKTLVFGAPNVVNRNYEGEISGYGDTVHIVSIADVSIVDYTKDTDLNVEVLTDAEQLLTIECSKAFAFEVDDIDVRQSRNGGALMTEAADRAGFNLADAADQYIAKKMRAAAMPLGVANAVLDVSTTVTDVYDKLVVPISVALKKRNVPTAGRFLIVDPSVYGILQLDPRFIRQNESGTAALHTGEVGNAGGFTIYESNNASRPSRRATATTANGAKTLTGVAGQYSTDDIGMAATGTGVGASAKIVSVNGDGSVATTDVNSTASAAVDVTLTDPGSFALGGSNIATSYAEQINKTEAFRPQKRFADALKGLHLYGARVVRPEALVVASVKTS